MHSQYVSGQRRADFSTFLFTRPQSIKFLVQSYVQIEAKAALTQVTLKLTWQQLNFRLAVRRATNGAIHTKWKDITLLFIIHSLYCFALPNSIYVNVKHQHSLM